MHKILSNQSKVWFELKLELTEDFIKHIKRVMEMHIFHIFLKMKKKI